MGVMLKAFLPGLVARMDDAKIAEMVAEVRRLTEYVVNGNVDPGHATPGGYNPGGESERNQA
jgi:hypothetical protein